MHRLISCVLALALLSACGQSTTPTTDATQDHPAPRPAAFEGRWSFDGSCASDNGMSLDNSGQATVTGAQGTWFASDNGQLMVITHGTDGGSYVFERRGEDLASADQRQLTAKRCT